MIKPNFRAQKIFEYAIELSLVTQKTKVKSIIHIIVTD